METGRSERAISSDLNAERSFVSLEIHHTPMWVDDIGFITTVPQPASLLILVALGFASRCRAG
jgi:hypothetical protein